MYINQNQNSNLIPHWKQNIGTSTHYLYAAFCSGTKNTVILQTLLNSSLRNVYYKSNYSMWSCSENLLQTFPLNSEKYETKDQIFHFNFLINLTNDSLLVPQPVANSFFFLITKQRSRRNGQKEITTNHWPKKKKPKKGHNLNIRTNNFGQKTLPTAEDWHCKYKKINK